MDQLTVATLVGSLRQGSLNRRLFEHARRLAPAGIELAEAPIRDLPLYDDDLRPGEGEPWPGPVQAMRDRLAGADAFLVVSPEYNYSLPGPLKNAIDWASRGPDQPFAGKAVAVMGASGGRLGTARMQYQLRQVMVFLDAFVVNKPEVMVAGAREVLASADELDDVTSGLVVQQLEALRTLAGRLAS